MNIPDANTHIEKIKDNTVELWDVIRHAQIGRNMNCVTHEVNNLLGAVLAYTELVQMNETVSEESNRMMNEVKGAVEKSTRLLGTITTVARKEKDLQITCALKELLENIIELYEFDLKRNRVTLKGNYIESEHSLEVNVAWLQRAIMYLFSESLEQALTCPVKSIRIDVQQDGSPLEVYFFPVGCEVVPSENSFNIGMARELASMVHADIVVDAAKGYGIRINP
jgi:C4-dicarboxylate-specific signal transduction histidine kinase